MLANLVIQCSSPTSPHEYTDTHSVVQVPAKGPIHVLRDVPLQVRRGPDVLPVGAPLRAESVQRLGAGLQPGQRIVSRGGGVHRRGGRG